MDDDVELRLTSLTINFDVVTRNCKATEDLEKLLADTIVFERTSDEAVTARLEETLGSRFVEDYGDDYARPIIEELEQRAGRMYRRLLARKARAAQSD